MYHTLYPHSKRKIPSHMSCTTTGGRCIWLVGQSLLTDPGLDRKTLYSALVKILLGE